jgi:hypothetical protein
MNDFSNALSVSSSGLRAQAQRLRHVAENIANADTPGYRRKTIAFEAARGIGAGGVIPGPPARRRNRPLRHLERKPDDRDGRRPRGAAQL